MSGDVRTDRRKALLFMWISGFGFGWGTASFVLSFFGVFR